MKVLSEDLQPESKPQTKKDKENVTSDAKSASSEKNASKEEAPEEDALKATAPSKEDKG